MVSLLNYRRLSRKERIRMNRIVTKCASNRASYISEMRGSKEVAKLDATFISTFLRAGSFGASGRVLSSDLLPVMRVSETARG